MVQALNKWDATFDKPIGRLVKTTERLELERVQGREQCAEREANYEKQEKERAQSAWLAGKEFADYQAEHK